MSAEETTLILGRRGTRSAPSYRGKRAFDVAFAGALLVFASPLLIALAALTAVTSHGSPLFRQERVGRDGTPFQCFKFRTMYADASERLSHLLDAHPELQAEFEQNFKLKCDPRVTPLGRFMRRTSLDELPQFLNVLRGEMSIVGPRPIVEAEVERFGKHADLILSVRPGITGLWQVSGRNDLPYEARVELNVTYVREWSLRTDLRIVARTIVQAFHPHRHGAY